MHLRSTNMARSLVALTFVLSSLIVLLQRHAPASALAGLRLGQSAQSLPSLNGGKFLVSVVNMLVNQIILNAMEPMLMPRSSNETAAGQELPKQSSAQVKCRALAASYEPQPQHTRRMQEKGSEYKPLTSLRSAGEHPLGGRAPAASSRPSGVELGHRCKQGAIFQLSIHDS